MVGGGHERKPLIGMHFTAKVERMFLLRGVGKGGREIESWFSCIIYIVRQWIPISRFRLPFSWLSVLSFYLMRALFRKFNDRVARVW